ncbi:MAG: hypothetical protein U0930_17165 [Pirellulales bacterium]
MRSIVVLCCLLIGSVGYLVSLYPATQVDRPSDAELHLRQLDGNAGQIQPQLMEQHYQRANWESVKALSTLGLMLAAVGAIVHASLKRPHKPAALLMLLVCVSMTGCWRPFEPVKLEVIQPNEEAFLLPFTEDLDAQSSTHTEEYLRRNLVHTQQVKIPQQWVPKGYETFSPNGVWQDAAILVRVDKSPVTREWTADPNSGTSAKNEAIWVMTSDQVEFSTGWTCTARIASRDDAVIFLHHYPNGALTKVMDHEIRAKLQSEFGLEVTDLPMEELRKKATPHIQSVTSSVKEFFQERGITITNLGISGGFVYKDPSIIKTLVEVFNAEQNKSIATAGASAQVEKNKSIKLEADARADAILTEAKAKAEGIRLVADAKNYEIEQAKSDTEMYCRLKQLELEREKLEKWDGRFPTYFIGGNGQTPDMLLQMPAVGTTAGR